MAGKPTSQERVALETFARANLGLFSAADAATAGVSSGLVRHHSRPGGRWVRVYPRIYRLAFLPQTRPQLYLAALMWAGVGAVLSHWAAAAVLGLDGVRAAGPELWTPRVHVPDGVIGHRGLVPPSDVVTRGPLRLTSPRRTVLDLAGTVDDDTLEILIESVLRHRLCSETELATTGCRGSTQLRRVLERRPAGAPPTESELETRYLQVVRSVDIPRPVRQYEVFSDDGWCVGRLDVCWPEVGLWVELDGRATHGAPRALLSDRHRQNELATRLQWLPLRFTWDDVVMRPRDTAHLTETAYRQRHTAERRLVASFT